MAENESAFAGAPYGDPRTDNRGLHGSAGLVARPLDFIVIGAAKSGTTTLFHYVRQHPDIAMPANKEAPFFTKDDVYRRGWDWYVSEYFSQARPGAMWGTITPRYLGDLHVPERIVRLMPAVRLVALLRNPVDRAFSKYRLLLRTGAETRPFAEMAAEQLAPAALDAARVRQLRIRDAVLVRGEYGRLLTAWFAWFPREQLQVHFTDELERQPQQVVDAVLRHVGLEAGYVPPNLGKRYYVGGDRQRFPRLLPWARRIAPFQALWRRVPGDRRRSLQLLLTSQLNVVDQRPPPFPDDLRARLVEFYQPDVRVLEALLGRRVPWAEFST